MPISPVHDIVVCLSQDLRCLYISQSGAELLGIVTTACADKPLMDWIVPAECPRVTQALLHEYPAHLTLPFMTTRGQIVFDAHIEYLFDADGALKSILMTAAISIAEQRMREMRLIHQAGADITRTFDLYTINEIVHRRIADLMDCDSFVISSYDQREKLIRAEYVYHEGEVVDTSVFPPLPFDPDTAPLDKGTQGYAIRTGESMRIGHYLDYMTEDDPGYYYDEGEITSRDEAPDDGTEETQSVLIVPLKLDDQVTGVIQVMSFRRDAYTEDHLRFVEAIAPYAAIATQNARLFRQIQGYQSELELRVQQRTEQLNQALVVERQLSELKARLMSMISHELRNPLTSILTSTYILDQHANRLTRARQHEHVLRIQEQAERMRRIMEDTLILGRTEAAGLQPRFEPNDLLLLVHKDCEDMRVLYPQRMIMCGSMGESQAVLVDRELVHHVMTNLLSNALKYSPPETPVHCELRYEPEQVTLIVRDHGIGIPQEEMAHIGEPFFRANNAHNIQGTGLGIALIYRIVEVHHGTIRIDSQVNQGTTVTITLPYQP